jgi:hypothetical protein
VHIVPVGVAELSGMPALLALLDRDEVAAADAQGVSEPPALRPEMLDSLLAKVSSRRRRTRMWTWSIGAVAAAVLAVGVLVAVRPGPMITDDTSARVSAAAMTMSPVTPSSFDATVTLSSFGWGTHIEMTCTYSDWPGEAGHHDDDAGDKLSMVAVGRDGSRTQLATWMALSGVTASPSGSTSMPVDEIVAVQIVSADTGDVLLQRNL